MNHPICLPFAEIEEIARLADRRTDCRAVFAGTTRPLSAPQGMAEIIRRGGTGGMGSTGGITLIKSASAFIAPRFSTTNSFVRNGPQVQHFASVDRTMAQDVEHESFYPAPGDHLRPGMSSRQGKQTIQYYWRITKEVSEMIRQGEQEHLDDARRAFELTYQLIADKINSLAGQKFGPAPTPAAAQKMAEAALCKLLPAQIGMNSAQWVLVLDRLLGQTKNRDTNKWHDLAGGPPVTEGNRVVSPLISTGQTQIGTTPSSQVVNY